VQLVRAAAAGAGAGATAAEDSRDARRELERVDGALGQAERGQPGPGQGDHGAADRGPADRGSFEYRLPDRGPSDRGWGTRAAEPPARGWGSDPGPAFDEALAAAARAMTAAEAAVAAGYFARLHYLGQLDLTYLVCEGDGELVLVDQHAAHERVELARLVARHTARDVATQKMLFPTTFEATPAQLALVARAAGVLSQVGFEAEPFGKATIAIKAMPAGLHKADPSQLLRRLLDEWAAHDGDAPTEAERVIRALAQIACHSVVRAGDRLTSGEAESLLRSLDTVDLQAPTPHGRATLLRLPIAEIGRRFGR
jgi:DNA mismatch repair protein MutL